MPKTTPTAPADRPCGRTLLLWCPDWPVIAAEIDAGVPAHSPVAILHRNRVVACSPAARAAGVLPGLRKREAQSRCPGLTAVAHDPARDARAFEPVVAAVEQLVAGVAVVRAGEVAAASRGPVRYHAGAEAAAERIVEQVAQACGVESQIGIADGVFAAGLAARAGRIVPAGGTPAFLAGLDIGLLGRPKLVDLLRRLGIQTLGDFAALPRADVLSRFGLDAVLAHRLAAGEDDQPLAPRQPPPELVVTDTFDEPLERVDVAAFAGRVLAERLHDMLTGYGLACTRLAIEAVTGNGEQLHRLWRHDGLLTATAISDRVRWQLDGWLSAPRRRGGGAAPARPTAGIVRLRLRPEGVTTQIGVQPGLWGDPGAGRERAHRALSRVQGILGPDGVVTGVPDGGRTVRSQVRWVPWGDERTATRPAELPWPGRLPPPAPATVLAEPQPVRVLAADGADVTVSARLALSAAPASLVQCGPGGPRPPVEIVAWAGPWPVEERWWAAGQAVRQARFQVCLADGQALLLALSAGVWTVEASYD